MDASDTSVAAETRAIQAMGGEGGRVLADWFVGLAEANRYV